MPKLNETVVLEKQDFHRTDIWNDLVEAAIKKGLLPGDADANECAITVAVLEADL